MDAKVKARANHEKTYRFGSFPGTRKREGGMASNRKGHCCGEYTWGHVQIARRA